MCLYWPCLVIRHDARTALGTTATWCLNAELQAWYLVCCPWRVLRYPDTCSFVKQLQRAAHHSSFICASPLSNTVMVLNCVVITKLALAVLIGQWPEIWTPTGHGTSLYQYHVSSLLNCTTSHAIKDPHFYPYLPSTLLCSECAWDSVSGIF